MKDIKKLQNQVQINEKALKSLWWFLPIFPTGLLAILGCVFCLLFGKNMLDCVQAGSLTVLCMGTMAFSIRKLFPIDSDNAEVALRTLKSFWFYYWVGELLAFFCIFLPNTTWPYAAIYVALGLYSNPLLGIIGGSSLLFFTTILSGSGASVFLLYFVIGIFSVVLFCPMKENFAFGFSLILDLLFILTALCGGVILTANEPLCLEQFVLPFVNIIFSALFLFGLVWIYSTKILYRYRNNILALNDSGNMLLVQMKEQNKKVYTESIHTAYFCDRIATKLGLNGDICKCCGYYHSYALVKSEIRESFFIQNSFPKPVGDILREYGRAFDKENKGQVCSKECAILVCTVMVIKAVLAMQEKSSDQAFDSVKVIDAIFKRISDNHILDYSELTFSEYMEMHQLFVDEKLYFQLLQ